MEGKRRKERSLIATTEPAHHNDLVTEWVKDQAESEQVRKGKKAVT